MVFNIIFVGTYIIKNFNLCHECHVVKYNWGTWRGKHWFTKNNQHNWSNTLNHLHTLNNYWITEHANFINNKWRCVNAWSMFLPSTWGLGYECCMLKAKWARLWQCFQTKPLLWRHQHAYRTCRKHGKFYSNPPRVCFPSNPNMLHPQLCLLLRLLSPISAAKESSC